MHNVECNESYVKIIDQDRRKARLYYLPQFVTDFSFVIDDKLVNAQVERRLDGKLVGGPRVSVDLECITIHRRKPAKAGADKVWCILVDRDFYLVNGRPPFITRPSNQAT